MRNAMKMGNHEIVSILQFSGFVVCYLVASLNIHILKEASVKYFSFPYSKVSNDFQVCLCIGFKIVNNPAHYNKITKFAFSDHIDDFFSNFSQQDNFSSLNIYLFIECFSFLFFFYIFLWQLLCVIYFCIKWELSFQSWSMLPLKLSLSQILFMSLQKWKHIGWYNSDLSAGENTSCASETRREQFSYILPGEKSLGAYQILFWSYWL